MFETNKKFLYISINVTWLCCTSVVMKKRHVNTQKDRSEKWGKVEMDGQKMQEYDKQKY